MLRAAREVAGLHIGALAVSLKVPVKKLEALEGDRIDLLPDAVFARALASSVCRTLKIDPGPVLANLPQVRLSRLVPEATGEKDSFRVTRQGASEPLFQDLPKPFVVIGLALVIGSVVVAFYPTDDKASHSSSAVSMVLATPAAEVAVQPAHSVLPIPTAPIQPLVNPPGGDAQLLPKSATVSEPVAAAAVQAPQITLVQPTPFSAVVAGTGLVVFKSKATAWVEVVDGAKVVQLRKTLVAGESVDVSGTLPLSVIVGKADSTEVLVRGKAFDLTPLVKDNVARFEVR
jgi:cytoskeleton protein RodZ